MPIAIRATIVGKVQGVFFRASTLEQAQALNIAGSVENLDDGGVQLVAQGDQANVEALLRWCHHGSPDAEVREVHVRTLDVDESRTAFRVLR